MKKLIVIIFLALSSSFLTLNAQIISTIAGTGTAAYCCDGGPATAAELNGPTGVVIDNSGNIYVADFGDNHIRKIDPTGTIHTIAGNGFPGYSGDGGQATAAELRETEALLVDASGNIFIACQLDCVVRKVNTSGIISTFAGMGNAGFSGDGGQATAAKLNQPTGVKIDATGNVYIADWYNNRIRIVNTSGIINTFAGNGTAGFSGDGGQATNAELNEPSNIALDASGNVYIADWGNNRIREVNPLGIISTIAGNGIAGFSGDGGQATNAKLNTPISLIINSSGYIYVDDQANFRIRKIDLSGTISTFAGKGFQGFSGDGGPATAAELNYPDDVVFDASGNLYIADADNNRVRMVTAAPLGINEVTNLNTQAVFPNPSNGIFTVRLENVSEKPALEIFNMLGEKILATTLDARDTRIDLYNKTSGIYLYRIIAESGNLVSEGKFIIQK